MKTLSLIKRAKKAGYTDSWSLSILHAAISWGFGYKFRPIEIYHTGNSMKRGWSYTDDTNSIIEALNKIGIKYRVGNDAPRGGRTGAFIEILSKISTIREKSLKSIPLEALRINGKVYARITDENFQILYRAAINKNFPTTRVPSTLLSSEWFELNEKAIPFVKVMGIEEVGVEYFKEFSTKILYYPNNPCTYFIVLEDDKELACNSIGALLKKYGFTFELDKENWRIKNNEIGCRFRSNIHPALYIALSGNK